MFGARMPGVTESVKGVKAMPYQSVEELPDRVKNHLHHHAQEIFRAAFNSALEQCGQEERAFAVAWSTVERDYEKGQDGQWHRKGE
jgi:cation transport regulator